MQTLTITEQYKDLASSTIAQAFLTGEPLTVALNVSFPAMKQILDLFMDEVVKEQAGFITFDENGEVLGAVICRDYCSPLPEQFNQYVRPTRCLRTIS